MLPSVGSRGNKVIGIHLLSCSSSALSRGAEDAIPASHPASFHSAGFSKRPSWPSSLRSEGWACATRGRALSLLHPLSETAASVPSPCCFPPAESRLLGPSLFWKNSCNVTVQFYHVFSIFPLSPPPLKRELVGDVRGLCPKAPHRAGAEKALRTEGPHFREKDSETESFPLDSFPTSCHVIVG